MVDRKGGTYIREKNGHPKLKEGSRIKHHPDGDMARNHDGTPATPATIAAITAARAEKASEATTKSPAAKTGADKE